MSVHTALQRCAFAVVTLALFGSVLAAPAAGAQEPPGGRPEQTLDRPYRGEAAVNALGDRLPDVAAEHELTAGQLRRLFRADQTLWVDPTLRLFYVEPPLEDEHVDEGEAPESAVVAESAPHPLEDTFLLHSNQGAERTIYLDFDGHEVAGTQWNVTYTGGDAFLATPFSIDDDPANFSDPEREIIQSVWQRVSEDYAPFNVDVTTEDPGTAALERSGPTDSIYGSRVSIAGSDTVAYRQICALGCGGVAYVNVFDHTDSGYYQPAFVFQKGLGGKNASAKRLAEAASHEVGHNLSLNHDGTSTEGYYRGHGAWAPIMGVGYDRPLVQWSNGEYPDANNSTSSNPPGQDDLNLIADADRTPLRADEDDNTIGTARNLGTPAPVTTGSGSISSRTDVDFFRFDLTGTETVTIRSAPAPVSPNLDIALTLLDSGGTPIGSVVDPPSGTTSFDVAHGLDAELAIELAAGTYYLQVDGVGAGDLTTGYSDYASLGDYDVEVLAGICALGDPDEDDDTRAEARLLVGGQSATGVHCDQDWYLVPGIENASLTATLTAHDADLELQLTDAAGTSVGTVTPGASTDTASLTIPSDGDYFLGVTGAGGVESGYTLDTAYSACPGDDNWEPDSSPSSLTNPGIKDGVICGANTADNASVELTAGQAVEITLDYTAALGTPNLWLYDGANWTFGPAQSAERKRLVYTPTETKSFMLQVYEPSGTATMPYRLHVRPLSEPAPTVTSIWKTSGKPGETVTITGTDLYTVSAVDFVGAPDAPYTVNSPTSITVTVPPPAMDGVITLTNPAGSATTPWFDVLTDFPPPPNDDFADRQPLLNSSGVVGGSNVGATTESGESTWPNKGASVWYTWTAPSPGELVMDTFGSDFDTILNVYTGSAVNGLTTVASNDDTGGLQSTLTLASVTGGTTYAIGINGYQGDMGNLTLNWTFTTDVSAPVISGIAPTSGAVGDDVTITGSALEWTSDVYFNGTEAAFSVVSDTELTATVPEGATDGPISAVTPGGTAISSESFTVTAPPPATSTWGTDGTTSRDVAFTDSGLAILDIESSRVDDGYYAAIQTEDGSIAVGKFVGASDAPDFAFNGGEGLVVMAPVAQFANAAGLLAVDSSGRPYLLATSRSSGDGTSHVRLVRLTTAGALDTTFSDDGIIDLVPAGAGDHVGAGIEIDGNNQPVVVVDDDTSTSVRRFTTAGLADAGFLGDETGSTTGSAVLPDLAVTADDLLAVLGDNSLVVAGTNAAGTEGRAMRLDNDGGTSTGWGISGANPANLGSDIQPVSVETVGATGGDGVLIGAATASTIDVLQLDADGTLDSALGGDGQVTALSGVDGTVASGHTNVLTTAAGIYVHGRLSSFNAEGRVVRLTASGATDTGWNTGDPGAPVVSSLAQVHSMHYDGALRLGGTGQSFGSGYFELLERFDSAGTFVQYGGEITVLGPALDYVQAIAPLAEAAYVAYGESDDRVTIVKHLDDGSLDTSFGDGDGALPLAASDMNKVDDMTVDSQGRLLLLGQWADITATPSNGTRIIRLTTAGALDTTFDGNGKLDLGPQIEGTDFSFGYDVRTDATDQVLVAGVSNLPTTGSYDPKVFVQRFTDAGATDTSFGGADGSVLFDLSSTEGENYTVGEIRLDSVGDLRVFASRALAGAGSEIAVVAIDGDGVLDTSYGTSGFARYACPGTNLGFVYGGNLLADGSAVFAASCDVHGPDTGARAGRFTPAGVLDTTYAGGAGTVRYLNANGDPLSLSVEQPVDETGAVYLHGFFGLQSYLGRISANGVQDATYEQTIDDDSGRPTAGGLDDAGRFYVGTNVDGAALVTRFAAVEVPQEYDGDINGDGYADVVVGVPEESIGAAAGAGAVNVLYGSSSGLSSTGAQQFTQSQAGGFVESGDRFGASMT